MRTEATPTSKAEMIMNPASITCKGRYWLAVSICVQIVPKRCQEYRNVSKDIELHRNAAALKNGPIVRYLHYFLGIMFFRRFLHTVEVRGSSPLSPTIFLSTTCTIPQPGKTTVVPKISPESSLDIRSMRKIHSRAGTLIGGGSEKML
jgi:hypothetical protein